jgi:hypothetical protein
MATLRGKRNEEDRMPHDVRGRPEERINNNHGLFVQTLFQIAQMLNH